MFNLLISGNEDDWLGNPFVVDSYRCAWEYTEDRISDIYKPSNPSGIRNFSRDMLDDIYSMPALFVYELGRTPNVRVGNITDIAEAGSKVRILYEVIEDPDWLTRELISANPFSFRLGDNELHRTHWAIKDAELEHELSLLGHNLSTSKATKLLEPDLRHA